MARKINLLSALKVERLSEPGRYHDGLGLYLQISKAGSKSWLYRYEVDRKGHWHGLGPYPDVPLSEAREKAGDCRKLRRNGLDPISYKQQELARRKLEAARGTTFKECALACIESHKAGWKNKKHADQWNNTLETYAFPVLGDLPVQDIDVSLVLKVIEPIWHTKTETATRVRQRIENVLDWSAVRGYRAGDNPARWRGHLDKLLPHRNKVRKVKHHKALHYTKVPDLFQELRKRDALSAKALEFTILTAARSGEVRGATWDEIDMEAGIWTVPADRMKAGRAHRVPLTEAAITLLKKVKETAINDFVFPGYRRGKPLSDASMLKLLQNDMGHSDLTVHGFRSSFRDWCAETTTYPREVAEAALAHTVKDQTEAAYQRGDMFDRRGLLMKAWSSYLTTTKADVVNLEPKLSSQAR